jgi:DNA-binding CsgD family transcriptional regulator
LGESVDNRTIDRPPATLDASRILAGAAVTAISTREPVTGKLGARDRAHAVALGLRTGLVT